MILLRCAKRSVLPDKTTSLKDELARLQSTLRSTKAQNGRKFSHFFSIILQAIRPPLSLQRRLLPTHQITI